MKMKKCKNCGKYTLKDACPVCNAATVAPGPAKYSQVDKYARYRRMMKREAGML